MKTQKLQGGVNFQLKGSDFTIYGEVDKDIPKIGLSLNDHGLSPQGILKKDEVTCGEVLFNTGTKTILAPISGSLNIDENNYLTITSNGKPQEVSTESIDLLRKEDAYLVLHKLGLLDSRALDNVKRLYLNLTHTEPFFADESLFVKEFGDKIKKAISNIDTLLPNREKVLIYKHEETRDFLNDLDGVTFFKVAKYPHDNYQLVASKHEDLPISDLDLSTSFYINAETLCVIYDYLQNSIPPVYTYVSVGGNIEEPKLLKVPMFSNIRSIVGKFFKAGESWEDDYNVVVGGPFSGRLMEGSADLKTSDHAVTILYKNKPRLLWSYMWPGLIKDSYSKTFVSALLPVKKYNDTQVHGEKRACIFCGYCEDICPAGIIPHVLYKNSDIDELEAAKQYKIMDCVECGLCTYACTSKISVSEKIKKGKENIIKENI